MKLKSMLAAAARLAGSPLEQSPENDAERVAWEAYHASWEMDPAPDPRSVFLAGFRAAKEAPDKVSR